MKPLGARNLLAIIAVAGIVTGLLLFGSSNSYEANLAVASFAVGGAAIVVFLGGIAARRDDD